MGNTYTVKEFLPHNDYYKYFDAYAGESFLKALFIVFICKFKHKAGCVLLEVR